MFSLPILLQLLVSCSIEGYTQTIINEFEKIQFSKVIESDICEDDYLNRSGGSYDYEDYNFINLVDSLEDDYPDYTWTSNGLHLVSDVSNALPVNVNGPNFHYSNIEWALNELELPSVYGGCGPIAMMSVLEYFYNVLGYEEIMSNPYNPDYKKSIAYDALDKMKTYELDNSGENTLSFPWDMRDGFNALMNKYGLSNVISAITSNSLPFDQESKWNTIVENINQGIPVTLMVGLDTVIGRPCGSHCTNIVGYQTFYGTYLGNTIVKDFIIVRLNFYGHESLYYCDAQVLNQLAVTLISYNFNYNDDYYAYASDFAQEFVNNNGGGQYFYYDISSQVELQNGRYLNTNRLRCSYIEDEYLVLSPKRIDAGTAYLRIMTLRKIPKLTFTAAMWGPNEDHQNETFMLQYKKGDTWNNHVEIDLNKISKNKDSPSTFTILFPKTIREIRFMTTHSNPVGLRNRGRVVLDNLHFESNV